MPVSNHLRRLSNRIARSLDRVRRDRSQQGSIDHIDDNARIEARDRQSAKDASAGAAENPADEGGEG